MIWVIASIPFWALAALLFFMTFSAMIHGTFSEKCQGEEYRTLMTGGIIVTLFAGFLAIVAAKLCS